MMVSADGEPSAMATFLKIPNKTPPDGVAKNVFRGGKCVNCKSDNLDETICCLFCKTPYHAVNCFMEQADNCFPNQGFNNQWKPALENKKGAWRRRPGNVRFICDYCMTQFEIGLVQTDTDKVDRLDERMNGFSEDMSELKKLVFDLTKAVDSKDMQQASVSCEEQELARPSSSSYSEMVTRQLITVKTTDQSVVSENKLGQILANNGVPFHKTFTNNGKTGIILPDKSSAKKAKEVLNTEIPNTSINEVKSRQPTINVVGFASEPSKEQIENDLKTLNDSVSSAIQLDVSSDETSIEVLGIRPLKNDNTLYRANIRVSNNVRQAISCQGNRVFTSQGSKKIYDSFYIRRCFKCQGFGHIAKDCPSDSHVCGKCAGDHRTDSCESENQCCSNCKKQGHQHDHSAFSQSCISYIKEQKKLQNSIQFHQKN